MKWEYLSLPEYSVIREAIDRARKDEIQQALRFMYLTCGRAKEVVARTTPGDKSGKNQATGPKGTDARREKFAEFDVALFNVYTQKRDGLKRIIALPFQYEPWAEPLLEYFERFGKTPVFNLSRQKLWRLAKSLFEGLTYPIEKYTIWKNGELVKTVDRHQKDFTLHALRHLRASELVEYYGFGGFELSVYGGWTMKTTIGISSQFDRYISLGWQSYVGKLLKKRTW